MAKEIIYLTAEGYKKLKDELDHMRSVERPAISAAIAEARDKGDLSENAEYDAAREAQGLLEMRIAKMEDTIANARIIDESKVDKSKVQILSRVTLLNHNTGKEVIYTIVAEHEANLREGKLEFTPAPQYPWFQVNNMGLERPLFFKGEGTHHVRLVVDDDIATIFVDDVALNARFCNKQGQGVALTVTDGALKCANATIASL